MYTIEKVKYSDKVSWDDYVHNSPRGNLYYTFEYREIIISTYGFDPYYLIAKKGDIIVGIFPIFYVKLKLFGNYMVSIPFCDYGGPIGDTREIENELIKRTKELSNKININYILIRTYTELNDNELLVKKDKFNFMLDLPNNINQMWDDLKPKVRNQIRKAKKNNLKFVIDKTNLGIKDFYKIFSIKMKDFGTPVHSIKLFNNMFLILKEKMYLCKINYKGKTIGSAIMLRHDKIYEVPFAATLKEYSHLCINHLMYWELLKLSIENEGEIFILDDQALGVGPIAIKSNGTRYLFPWIIIII